MRRSVSGFVPGTKDNWRNIPIALTDTDFGEQTAQACVNAYFRQLRKFLGQSILLRRGPTLPRFPDFFGGARGVDLLAFSGCVNENRRNLAR